MSLQVLGARVRFPTVFMSTTESLSRSTSMALLESLFRILRTVRIVLNRRIRSKSVNQSSKRVRQALQVFWVFLLHDAWAQGS